jgi:hypothetical protein
MVQAASRSFKCTLLNKVETRREVLCDSKSVFPRMCMCLHRHLISARRRGINILNLAALTVIYRRNPKQLPKGVVTSSLFLDSRGEVGRQLWQCIK